MVVVFWMLRIIFIDWLVGSVELLGLFLNKWVVLRIVMFVFVLGVLVIVGVLLV